MARRRRKGKAGKWVGRVLSALLAVPALYFLAAFIGSLVPMNRGWAEPARGHDRLYRRQRHPCRHHHAGEGGGRRLGSADPEERLRRRRTRARAGSPSARASGGSISTRRRGGTSGRGTIWSALAGGKRVMHVEYVSDPAYAARQIRLRPEEYRRLMGGDPRRFGARRARPAAAHQPSGLRALRTLSTRRPARRTRSAPAMPSLRAGCALAGVKVSVWPPFVPGLLWRYEGLPVPA